MHVWCVLQPCMQVNRVKRTIEQSLQTQGLKVQKQDAQKVLDVMARPVTATAKLHPVDPERGPDEEERPKKHRRCGSMEPQHRVKPEQRPEEAAPEPRAKGKAKSKATAMKAELRRTGYLEQAAEFLDEIEKEQRRAASSGSTLARGLREELDATKQAVEDIIVELGQGPACDLKRIGAEMRKVQGRMRNHKSVVIS